jgi:hypothetical protein
MNAEQARQHISHDDRPANYERGNGGCLHRYRQALDHIGAMTGCRGQGDAAHRAVFRAGIVFGYPDQQPSGHQAHDRTPEQVEAREADASGRKTRIEAEHIPGNAEDQYRRQDSRCHEPLVESAHDILAGAELDEERAGYGCQNANAADRQRIQHHIGKVVGAHEKDRGQHHGGDHGYHIGLEQVGRHAGAVAYIIAHIVGDHRRVAGVVLGDAGLYLAHQVGAHIGALGEDAAPETREDRNQRRTEA